MHLLPHRTRSAIPTPPSILHSWSKVLISMVHYWMLCKFLRIWTSLSKKRIFHRMEDGSWMCLMLYVMMEAKLEMKGWSVIKKYNKLNICIMFDRGYVMLSSHIV
ncbi:uncharacterized protein LOC110881606 [Helianthus annuus]|uniref:uncharacterized protein LOC110881606 n=1 Tax=Helianthus annuus TaxID=4232 RepID=UPI000B90861A|nr:uncharacterized protein LOC110881606 [Helianthus annuus]